MFIKYSEGKINGVYADKDDAKKKVEKEASQDVKEKEDDSKDKKDEK